MTTKKEVLDKIEILLKDINLKFNRLSNDEDIHVLEYELFEINALYFSDHCRILRKLTEEKRSDSLQTEVDDSKKGSAVSSDFKEEDKRIDEKSSFESNDVVFEEAEKQEESEQEEQTKKEKINSEAETEEKVDESKLETSEDRSESHSYSSSNQNQDSAEYSSSDSEMANEQDSSNDHESNEDIEEKEATEKTEIAMEDKQSQSSDESKSTDSNFEMQSKTETESKSDSEEDSQPKTTNDEEEQQEVAQEVIVEEKEFSFKVEEESHKKEEPSAEEPPRPAKSITESYSASKPQSINDRISALRQSSNKEQEPTNRTFQKPKDIKTLINLNDKLIFIKELFNGYSLAYSEALELLNRYDSYEKANAFLQNNYAEKNNWSAKKETADKFYSILRKRFS